LFKAHQILNGLHKLHAEMMYLLVSECRATGTLRKLSFLFSDGKFCSLGALRDFRTLPQKAVEAGILNIFKPEVDRFLFGNRTKGYRRQMEMLKSKHKQISHDLSEWRGSLVGPSGLLLPLFPLFVCPSPDCKFPLNRTAETHQYSRFSRSTGMKLKYGKIKIRPWDSQFCQTV